MKHIKADRRTFLKGAVATVGGLAFSEWAATNFEAAAQDGQAFVIVSDVIRGSQGNPTGPSCVETSVFQRGEQVVWRAVVYDAATGEALNTPEAVADRGLTMSVTPEGQGAIDMGHGPHPPASRNPAPEDVIYYWTGTWEIPPVVSGRLKYTIVVEDGNGGQGVMEVAGNKDVDTFPIALDIS